MEEEQNQKCPECEKEPCECGDEEEEMSTAEIADHADDKIDALVQLLIKKGVITEEEYNKEFESLFEEEAEENSE